MKPPTLKDWQRAGLGNRRPRWLIIYDEVVSDDEMKRRWEWFKSGQISPVVVAGRRKFR